VAFYTAPLVTCNVVCVIKLNKTGPTQNSNLFVIKNVQFGHLIARQQKMISKSNNLCYICATFLLWVSIYHAGLF